MKPSAAPSTPPSKKSGGKRRILGLGCIAVLLALGAGFFWFTAEIPDGDAPFNQSADGIVAFTGGPERIVDAVELLAAGRGKRLLITGVNRVTRAEELSRLMPRYQAMFNCCIDLDHSALNTIGNAVETRRWARDRGFQSLVVVTARHHMPRALAELNHQLPDVTLIPYPVVPEKQRGETWWSNTAATRTLAFEYLKYLAAIVRMRIAPGYTGTDEGVKSGA